MRSFGNCFTASAFSAMLLAAAFSEVRAETPTFTKDVAPILWKNCAGCHRPGEVGPFSLLTYEDAAKRADFMAEITASRRMPPWKAEPNFGNVPRRASAERCRHCDLADAGPTPVLRKVTRPTLPAPPKFVDGWQLGEPDLVLEMPEEFDVPADGPDIYQCFVLPIPTTEHRTVAAANSGRAIAASCIMRSCFSTPTERPGAKDAAEPGQGYKSFGGPGVLPTGGLGSWAPVPFRPNFPKGIGKFLRHGSDLVLADSLPPRRQAGDGSLEGRHLLHERAGHDDRRRPGDDEHAALDSARRETLTR